MRWQQELACFTKLCPRFLIHHHSMNRISPIYQTNLITCAQVGAHAAQASSNATLRRANLFTPREAGPPLKKDGQSPAKKYTPPTRSQGGPTLICDPRRCTQVTRRQAVLNAPNREDGTTPSSECGECSRFRKTTRTTVCLKPYCRV